MTWKEVITEYIRNHPGCTRYEIEHVYRKATHLHEIINRMEKDGLLTYETRLNKESGRMCRYYTMAGGS